jgi:sugar phosphate isomerase/epimerase
MDFALSTNWNASRHATGEALVDEILALGFRSVELGYKLTVEQAAGVSRRIASGAVTVSSVHAYCPVPVGAPSGHPELYLLASRDEDERALATIYLMKTMEFAAKMGSQAVVMHSGRVKVKPFSDELIAAAEEETDGCASRRYQKLLARLQRRRARKAGRHLDALRGALDHLVPRFAKAGLTLCLENLPSWEAIPTETEMQELVQRYASPALAYWHDMGHGQIRHNLGWIDHRTAAEALLPHTRGIHIHDVRPLANDHLAPGQGALPFADFAFYGRANVLRVFEPGPQVKPADLSASLAFVRAAWEQKSGVRDPKSE